MPTSSSPVKKKKYPATTASDNRSVASHKSSNSKRPVAKKKKPVSSDDSVATNSSRKKKKTTTNTAIVVAPPQSSKTTTTSYRNNTNHHQQQQRNRNNHNSNYHDNDDDDNDDTRNRRNFICAILICCCCCILLVVILVLLFVVFEVQKGNDGSTETTLAPAIGTTGPTSPRAPTFQTRPPSTLAPRPTLPPVMIDRPSPDDNNNNPQPPQPLPPTPPPFLRPTQPPVVAPTSLIAPTNSFFVLIPFADTVVFRNGFYEFEAFGSDDSMLVQNGPRGSNIIPDAVAVIAFDLNQLPVSINNFDTATLQLFHIAASRNRGPATLTIRRLPSTRFSIETLHGGLFTPSDTVGMTGPSFSVSPNDGLLQINVSNLLFQYQAASNDDNTNQVLFMIENRGPEQTTGGEGDRFYTRETDDPPQLILRY